MTLTVLGSESSGNCYLLGNESECIIIEAGISIKKVKPALNFDMSKVKGVLCTHLHGDHSKYLKEYAICGLDTYASRETYMHVNLSGHRANAVREDTPFMVGRFMVVPFKVPHGGVHCLGFLIHHHDCGKVLFVTDASEIPYKFNGLSHVLIEANYDHEVMVSDRAVGKHMSLTTAMSFLRRNELGAVRNIVLLHLSAANSDASAFSIAIKELAPNATVTVADKGIKVEMNKTPF